MRVEHHALPQQFVGSDKMLSVVFSFRNEEEVLPELIRRTRAVLDGECEKGTIQQYELIFVNDDSTDQSKQILLDHTNGHDDIKIINMSRNFGVAPCVLAGMQYTRGDAVVYMDADLQDPPETISELIKAWQGPDGVDVVHTVRLSRAGESWFKLWVTRLGYRILRKFATIDLQIEAGDFKLLSRRAIDQLIGLKEKNAYIRGMVNWIGFGQTTIRYHREARYAGRTKFPTLCMPVVRHFLDSALISFSDVPLKLATLMGFIVSFGAFAYILWIILEKLRGHNIPGWSAIMVTMLMLGGVQQFSIGFLGLYIKSIYLETKRRPNYIIESTFGLEQSAVDETGPLARAA